MQIPGRSANPFTCLPDHLHTNGMRASFCGIYSESYRAGIRESGRANYAIGPRTRAPRRTWSCLPDVDLAVFTSARHSCAWRIQASLPHRMMENPAALLTHCGQMCRQAWAMIGWKLIIPLAPKSVQGFTTKEALGPFMQSGWTSSQRMPRNAKRTTDDSGPSAIWGSSPSGAYDRAPRGQLVQAGVSCLRPRTTRPRLTCFSSVEGYTR